MMADKAYFCFLLEWAEMFGLLTDAQSGMLIKAMIAYEKNGATPSFTDSILQFAWLSSVKPKMDTLKEHYDSKRKQTSEAGRRSAEKRKQSKQQQRTLTDVNVFEQNQQTLTDVDNKGLDLETDLVKKEDTDEKGVQKKYQQVVDEWNKLPLPNITAIRGKRLEALRAREKEYSLEDIVSAIHGISESPFLLGQNQRGWQITFDWFVKPNNFPKVFEGNYKSVNPAETDVESIGQKVRKAVEERRTQGKSMSMEDIKRMVEERRKGEGSNIT